MVGTVRRFVPFKNSKARDPHVAEYAAEKGISDSVHWGLPTLNREALYKSLSKYAKGDIVLGEVDERDFLLAAQWMSTHFRPHMADAKIRTIEEAICQTDLSKSPGIPFSRVWSTKGDVLEKDPNFSAWLATDWETLASDPDYIFVGAASLKEEIRPREKINSNSIRTFIGFPMDATIHGGRLYGEMNQFFYDSHLATSSAVGINPISTDWHDMMTNLLEHPHAYALDESEYDSSLFASLLWAIAKFRWTCFAPEEQTPENFERHYNYYRNIICTIIATSDGTLVMKKTGNPSGSPNTIVDNTLALFLLLCFACIQNCPPEHRNYKSFITNVVMVLVGDDNTWSVSELAHSFFNYSTVSATWANVGITTTTTHEFARPANECDFLSALTVQMQKGLSFAYVPIYDCEKLYTSLQYCSKRKISPTHTLERLTGMLNINWQNHDFRYFARDFLRWMKAKYHYLMRHDPEWIAVLGSFQDDAVYRNRLLSYPQPVVYTQSVQPLWGTQEGTTPHKKTYCYMHAQLRNRQDAKRNVQRQTPAKATPQTLRPTPRSAQPAPAKRNDPGYGELLTQLRAGIAKEKARGSRSPAKQSQRSRGASLQSVPKRSNRTNPNGLVSRRAFQGWQDRHGIAPQRLADVDGPTMSFHQPDGTLVGQARCLAEGEKTSRAPLALGTTYSGMRNEVTNFLRKDEDGVQRAGCRVKGRELLGTISILGFSGIAGWSSGASIGDRLAVYHVDASSLAGQLALFSDIYRFSRLLRAKIIISPLQPATYEGALAITFNSDPHAVGSQVGVAGLRQASTTSHFMEFPVWQEAHLDIKPRDLIKEYLSPSQMEVGGAFVSQGTLEVVAASTLATGYETDTSRSFPLSNAFIEYEYEFWVPVLSREVDQIYEGWVALQLNHLNGGIIPATTKNYPVVAIIDEDTTNTLNMGVFGNFPIAHDDLPNFVFQLIAVSVTYTGAGSVTPEMAPAPNFEPLLGGVPGQSIVMRFFRTSKATNGVVALMYENMAAANHTSLLQSSLLSGQSASDGQICWSNDVQVAQPVDATTVWSYAYRAVRIPLE